EADEEREVCGVAEAALANGSADRDFQEWVSGQSVIEQGACEPRTRGGVERADAQSLGDCAAATSQGEAPGAGQSELSVGLDSKKQETEARRKRSVCLKVGNSPGWEDRMAAGQCRGGGGGGGARTKKKPIRSVIRNPILGKKAPQAEQAQTAPATPTVGLC